MSCAFTLEVTAGFSRMFFSYSSDASSPLQADAVSEPPAEKKHIFPYPNLASELVKLQIQMPSYHFKLLEIKVSLETDLPAKAPEHVQGCRGGLRTICPKSEKPAKSPDVASAVFNLKFK